MPALHAAKSICWLHALQQSTDVCTPAMGCAPGGLSYEVPDQQQSGRLPPEARSGVHLSAEEALSACSAAKRKVSIWRATQ